METLKRFVHYFMTDVCNFKDSLRIESGNKVFKFSHELLSPYGHRIIK